MNEDRAPVAILDHGSYLVVSINAALDDTQMVQFRRELAEAIGGRRVRGLLIDVAALDVLDSFGSQSIRDLAEIARLRGATVVVVGVEPHLALAMVRLGIDAGTIPSALDLDDGLRVVEDACRPVSQGPTPNAPDGTRSGGTNDE